MLTFLLFSALVVAAVTVGSVLLIPLMVVGGLLWLITLPFRLLFGFVFGGLFRLVFGLIGAVFGLIGGLLGILLAPLGILIAGVGIAAAIGIGGLALFAPLLPVAIVAAIVWCIYRMVRPTRHAIG